MDKPSPNNPHLHDWLGQSFSQKPFDPSRFDSRQMIETMSAGFGPVKSLTVQQMELISLISRRAQAYLAIPQRLSRCRTHADLVNEQMRFWQTALSQYQDSTARITHAWSELFAALPDAGGAGASGPSVTFPAKPAQAQDGKTADLIRMPGNANGKSLVSAGDRPRRDRA